MSKHRFGSVKRQTIFVALNEDGERVASFTYGEYDGTWNVWDESDRTCQTIARYTSETEARKRAYNEAKSYVS